MMNEIIRKITDNDIQKYYSDYIREYPDSMLELMDITDIIRLCKEKITRPYKVMLNSMKDAVYALFILIQKNKFIPEINGEFLFGYNKKYDNVYVLGVSYKFNITRTAVFVKDNKFILKKFKIYKYFTSGDIIICNTANTLYYGCIRNTDTYSLRYDYSANLSSIITKYTKLQCNYSIFSDYSLYQDVCTKFRKMSDKDFSKPVTDIFEPAVRNTSILVEKNPIINELIAKKPKFTFRRYDNSPCDYGFDFVDCEVFLTRQGRTYSEQKAVVQKYIKSINNIVLVNLTSNSKFNNYDIPLNFLKIGNLVLTRDDRLIYTLELKGADVYQ